MCQSPSGLVSLGHRSPLATGGTLPTIASLGRCAAAETMHNKTHPCAISTAQGVCLILSKFHHTNLYSRALYGGSIKLSSPSHALPTARFGFSVLPPKHRQSVSKSSVSLPARGRVSV